MTEWLPAKREGNAMRVWWPEGYAKPPEGKSILVKVRQARNVKHHRKYWGLLKAVVEATGRWPSPEAAHRWIKVQLEHYQLAQIDDHTILEWLPTDFAAMGQAEFSKFYDGAIFHIAVETGLDPETIKKEAGQ